MSDPIVRRGEQIDLDIRKQGKIYLDIEHPVVIGAKDYNELTGKPKINGITIEGEKDGSEYNLQNLLVPGSNIEIVVNDDHTATISAIGGSSGELTADLKVSNPIGRYKMDDVIDEGTSFEAIFRGLLSKTYYPTLTNPSMSLTYNPNTLMKVGAMVASSKATLNFNRGSINPQYTSESQYRSGEATEYGVSLLGASITYSDKGDSNSFTIPEFTRNSKGNVTLNASTSYAAGVQPKDSDGNNYQSPLPAGSVSATKTIEFILPFYYGKSATSSISSLAGLTEDLTKKGQKVYTFTTDNEYSVVAYDSSYGNLRSIIDENGFENIDGWHKTTKTIDGQSYNIYVPEYATTGTLSFTFKF